MHESWVLSSAPVVSTVSANAAPSGSGTVTISGLSFGVVGPTTTASLTAADVCGSSAWTSATTVACAVQAYGNTVVRTAVSVSGVAGTVTGQLSFDGAMLPPPLPCCHLRRVERRTHAAPVVSTVSANAAPSGGGSVTISGLSFGVVGPTATASLTAADVCGSSAWTSATTVACAVQASGNMAVRTTAVSVSGVAGTVTGQLSFDGAMRRCLTALLRPMSCGMLPVQRRW